MPLLGIELTNMAYQDNAPTNWTTQPGQVIFSFKDVVKAPHFLSSQANQGEGNRYYLIQAKYLGFR